MVVNRPGWFVPGNFRYLDTNEPYRGEPARIELGNTIKYFDITGREILPVGEKEPDPPTAEQLFWCRQWIKQ